jgi:hypothetical protein
MAESMFWDRAKQGTPGFWLAEHGGVSVLVNLKRREVRTIVAVESATNEDCDVAGAALTAIGIADFDSITQSEPGFIQAVARLSAATVARFVWSIPAGHAVLAQSTTGAASVE